MSAADEPSLIRQSPESVAPAAGGVTAAPAVVAPPIRNPPTDEQIRSAKEYASDILGSRYELYAWCESKVQNLVTVSGVLLGAVFLIITNDKIRKGWTSFDYTLASVGSVLLATGLILSLYHIVPRMNSRIGKSVETNPRVTVAIEKYSMDEYYETILGLTPEASLRFMTDQIKGMSRNIMRSQRAIRLASYSTIAGLIVLGALVARSVL